MTPKHALLPLFLLAGAGSIRAQAPAPPIACNPRALSLEQRKELHAIGVRCIEAITSSRDLPDGYAFHLDQARVSILDVARWLDLWRKCCPFYEFQIDFRASDASLWMSVKGRPGVKEYIPVDLPTLIPKLPKL